LNDNKIENIGVIYKIEYKNVTGYIFGGYLAVETMIDQDAFSGYEKLKNITLPKNITVIERDVFENCAGLTSVTFENTIPYERFSESAFNGDLRDKFYETDKDNGTPGTYTAAAPVGEKLIWTRK
jgi:hypothetical protein